MFWGRIHISSHSYSSKKANEEYKFCPQNKSINKYNSKLVNRIIVVSN